MSQARRHGAYQGKLSHLRQQKDYIRLKDIKAQKKARERAEILH
jgi:hypothetical protein